ncbi:MAG: helix-turn-helix transcriptional regulator [Thermoguttaceae bacterium]
MGEQAILLRQWLLLKTLSVRRLGATLKELAAEMQVSEKTIRRDLETFLAAGFPLAETTVQFGRKKWHLDADKFTPGMAFTFDEALAFYLGRHLLEPLAGTPIWEAAQRGCKKIRASLGETALRYVDKFAGIFRQTSSGRHDYSGKAEVIEQLMRGIEDCRAVFITYQSMRATEPVTYDVYPYGLAYHRGSLYLVGRNPQREQVCHWKVDRIEKASVEEFRFQRPDGFDLERHLAGSFGIYHTDGGTDVRIRVRFSPSVARYVRESQWHASQKLTKERDGGLLAEFCLGDTAEIKRWIMSFGGSAVVLEPEGLQVEILAELESLIVAYGRRNATADRASAKR